ncbi:Microsomal signal peptidase subunit [Intoshia linei]|uniref:Signal peptidase complex subunit 1 n=1 Tax=Intoshia linei TaxID=1819745 RepID=A0A177AST3_9BILA|nr:Microsomal signal peptidase subunit [Intoshia linei]
MNLPILNYLRSIPVHMDYKGQSNAASNINKIIIFTSIIGFVVGFVLQQYLTMLIINMCGMSVAAIVSLVPWPSYRKNPIKWQKSRYAKKKKD